jgi:hypothetical protein
VSSTRKSGPSTPLNTPRSSIVPRLPNNYRKKER